MLFHVRMDVAVPRDLDPEERATLLATEKARALELQRKGTWVHLWRVVGQYRNVSSDRSSWSKSIPIGCPGSTEGRLRSACDSAPA